MSGCLPGARLTIDEDDGRSTKSTPLCERPLYPGVQSGPSVPQAAHCAHAERSFTGPKPERRRTGLNLSAVAPEERKEDDEDEKRQEGEGKGKKEKKGTLLACAPQPYPCPYGTGRVDLSGPRPFFLAAHWSCAVTVLATAGVRAVCAEVT